MDYNQKSPNKVFIIENCNPSVASKIHNVFQSSYKVEKEILGLERFPPLDRSIKDIMTSKTIFYGISHFPNKNEDKKRHKISGICELSREENKLTIDSLTVIPAIFRLGIATELLQFIIRYYNKEVIYVSTAAANTPAVNLYKKNGFIIDRFESTDCGLMLVKMYRYPDNFPTDTLNPS